jgi:hypothetical protein
MLCLVCDRCSQMLFSSEALHLVVLGVVLGVVLLVATRRMRHKLDQKRDEDVAVHDKNATSGDPDLTEDERSAQITCAHRAPVTAGEESTNVNWQACMANVSRVYRPSSPCHYFEPLTCVVWQVMECHSYLRFYTPEQRDAFFAPVNARP